MLCSCIDWLSLVLWSENIYCRHTRGLYMFGQPLPGQSVQLPVSPLKLLFFKCIHASTTKSFSRDNSPPFICETSSSFLLFRAFTIVHLDYCSVVLSCRLCSSCCSFLLHCNLLTCVECLIHEKQFAHNGGNDYDGVLGPHQGKISCQVKKKK